MVDIPSNLDALNLANMIRDKGSSAAKEELLSMISRKAIDSWFQPIVDLFTNSIYAYEMLARGEREFFSPGKMFAAAEQNDMEWEIEYACRLAALEKISKLDNSFNDTFFFLNVSPHIFNNPEFKSGFTTNFLKDHGLDHRKIVLEITEKATIERYSLFEELIKHYVEQGFKVALDDFGAGHSGLATLVAMTPHYMKVDRDIINGISTSPYKQNLLKTLSRFASEVGSNVLAEGIETFEDLETVFRLGVRYVQGFYLGRPSPGPERLNPDVKHKLDGLISRFRISDISTTSFLNDIIIRPDTFPVATLNCRDLDIFFKRNQMADHIVVTRDNIPERLITRQAFYKVLSGRFGFSLYSKHIAEDIIRNDFLTIRDDIDLLTIKKIALGRNGNDAFDPIVIIDRNGVLTGTITMKKLIEKAIDLEILNAINQNPLTLLPGNSTIRMKMEQLSEMDTFSIIYIDIDHFKQYNDSYGFDMGDRMITLLSDILKEFRLASREDIFLGHIGGDDFILIFQSVIDENSLERICGDFDSRKKDLFNPQDRERGAYSGINRQGEDKEYPLTTISLAAFSSSNFNRTVKAGELAHYAAELKKIVKTNNYISGRSSFIYERRIY